MAREYSRISTGTNPPYVLDLDVATTLMEVARSLVMAPTMPWLGLGAPRTLSPCKTVTTRWSVYSTKCLVAFIPGDSFYHSMKPGIPYSNLRQGEPYYTGYQRFGTGQLPGPAMSFSPHLPEADLDQDASPSSEWRLHNCWVSHAEEDGINLTYGNDAYGGGSISGYGSNHAMAGSSGTSAPQPLQIGGYSMVSVFHQMSSDNHPLILSFHEAKYSLQQP